MLQRTAILLFVSFISYGQPKYTSLRAAIGVEALGTAPQGSLYADLPLRYETIGFWNWQFGLGIVSKAGLNSPSLSSGISYCFLLNPYHRPQCVPYSESRIFQTFVELGLSAFVVDRYDNNKYLPKEQQQRFLTPMALAGLRFQFVVNKLIYQLKIRYTPALVSSKLTSQVGIAVGFGWQ